MSIVSDVLSGAAQAVQNKVPYLWGGVTQFGADCSGFVKYLYQNAGVTISGRTSEQQATLGSPVSSLDQAQPGDLLFYNYEGTNSHEAIYAGNGMQYAETQPGTTATLQPVDPSHLDAIRRFVTGSNTSAGPGVSVSGAAASSSTTPNAPTDSVVSQILAQAPSLQVAEAMLLGSSFEGGWSSPFPVGDQGTSFGPFQEHEGGVLTASGDMPAQAQDPAHAVSTMLPYYEGAVNRNAALFNTNPELAAEQSAVGAEGPAQSYLSAYGQPTLDAHWSNVQSALQSGTSGGTAVLTAASTGSGSSIADPQGFQAQGTIGTMLQYLDGFLNPSISAVPGWVNLFTGANSIISLVATIVDRALGVVTSAVIVYIGVRGIQSGNGAVGVIQKQQGLNIARTNAQTGSSRLAAELAEGAVVI